MNENILSNNLNRIKTATDSIREIVAMPTEDITDVAVAVEGISSDLETANSTIVELEQEIEEITPKGTIDILDNGTIDVSRYASANVNVSGGGGDWERPSDWWDTETILTEAPRRNATTGEEDENGLYPAYIVLLDDSDKTTTFAKNTNNYNALRYDAILTSDGSWYTADDVLHTWDESKDKSCSEGYKTRYFIVYFNSKNKSDVVALGQFLCLEVIVGDIVVPNDSMIFGSSGGSYANNKIKHYKELENTIHNAFSSSSTFQYCSSLRSVSLPNLMSISAGSTFQSCFSLTSVSLPSLTSISATYTFQTCVSLASISLPNLMSIAGSNTFFNCFSLTSVSLPNLTSINDNVTGTFQNCYSLASVSLPSLTSIGYNAYYTFYNCASLTSVSLPSLTSIGTYATHTFSGCYSLTSVSLPSLISIDGRETFNNCFSLSRFELPSTIAFILNNTSSFGSSLKALILPNDFALDLNLTGEKSLTHSALLNIIDKLKDFSVEGGTHTLTLGTTNLAKLSSDEIAIATDKGWTVQ